MVFDHLTTICNPVDVTKMSPRASCLNKSNEEPERGTQLEMRKKAEKSYEEYGPIHVRLPQHTASLNDAIKDLNSENAPGNRPEIHG